MMFRDIVSPLALLGGARPDRSMALVAAALMLGACQSVPVPSGFSEAQKAVLRAEGFTETELGWELPLADRLLFAVDESVLDPARNQALADMAGKLAGVGITQVRVEGHTDSTGSSAYNLALSQTRAKVVADALRAGGLPVDPAQVIGRGETMPLSPNTTPEGRQENRRVVVIVTPPQ